MGVFQGSTTPITDSLDPKNGTPTTTIALYTPSKIDPDQYFDSNEVKNRTLLTKMVFQLSLSCFGAQETKKQSKNTNTTDKPSNGKSKKLVNLEHNKAWLLAESGGGEQLINVGEPHSLHSSFRFSFCSQVELESLNINSSSSSSSATVLMVNLDNGVNDTAAKELKCKRLQSLERSISPVASSLVRFSYGEIVAATRNFSKGRVLGRGALSFVFRGRVGLWRTTVAIKRLDREDKESPKAFCRELMIASSLRHPNIVPLVGFCIDPEEGLFLVYKYESGGSLERHLHDKRRGVTGGSRLPWSVRYKAAVGIAEAISYMHNGTERCVVHRDIKPSNILLSSKKKPKLCDFGLASWTSSPSVPFLCKTVKGTFGYLAPEYFQHGKVSDKMDVYAFGVVLLELITGRKPIEAKRPQGEENLVLWAKPLLRKGRGAIQELIDPGLKCTSSRNVTRITRMIHAAAACVSNEESQRPGIDEIIAMLRGEEDETIYSSKRKSGLSGIMDCYPQIQQTKSEMNSHLALAMLGVSEFEDDDHFYCR